MKICKPILQLSASLILTTTSILSALAQNPMFAGNCTASGSVLNRRRLFLKNSFLIGLILISIGASCVLAQNEPLAVKVSAIDEGIFHLSIGNAEAHSTFLADTNAASRPVGQPVSGYLNGVQTADGELLFDLKSGELTLKNSASKILIPQHAIGPLTEVANEIRVELGAGGSPPIVVYGCGNNADSLTQFNVMTHVGNGRVVIPYYWSPAGYAVLAISEDDNRPAYWHAAANGEFVTWIFPGHTADLYLMPAATLKDAAKGYAQLTGHTPVPPLWAFGYLQSRWGWKNRAYIEDTLQKFSNFHLPVDGFIYDFEWFISQPDYGVPPSGAIGYSDFGWNPNLFPEPAKQIHDYKEQGVHFIGIRKPRLGNEESLGIMRSKGWALNATASGFESRDLNFANPDLRKWYIQHSAPLILAGVDGWWNDEGEASYTTYFYWNLAESNAWAIYRPNQRLWTINRAFSPGVQRIGATAWTGDIQANWKELKRTPTDLLNWSLAGMPYGACDIGGFFNTPSAELLTRWMEAGVFFPIMRAHSEINAMPHFPWLYGTNAMNAIRDALDLRYRLIPFYYSLAHETFHTGLPLMRPLLMEFPDDPHVANLADEWMMGDSILAAPVLKSSAPVEVVSSNWLKTDGGQTGLRSDYFANEHLSGAPAFTRTDANIDFDWDENSPAPDFPREHFSARWTGTIETPASVGEIKLATLEDDGARMWIDGKPVIDAWGPHSSSITEGSATLTAGVPHGIRVEYQQLGGDAAIQLLWHSTSTNSNFNAVRSVYLPAGDWFVFDTNRSLAGNQTIQVSATLDNIPVYVRAGSILPLGPIIQHTTELPGGPLELQIYPGKDATFTLVEDDGQTFNYQNRQTRRTTFQWNDADGTLTWKRDGDYSGNNVFKQIRIVLFDAKNIVQAESSLNAEGSLHLRK